MGSFRVVLDCWNDVKSHAANLTDQLSRAVVVNNIFVKSQSVNVFKLARATLTREAEFLMEFPVMFERRGRLVKGLLTNGTFDDALVVPL